MIGVDVGVDHVRDAQALAPGERFVRLHIVSARVDDGASAERATAKQISGAAPIEVIGRKIIVRPSSQADSIGEFDARRFDGAVTLQRRLHCDSG